MYYNTDARQIETFENNTRSWVAKDVTRNFGGHNLFPNSAVSSFSTGQQLNIATGYADPFGGTNAVYLQANTATSTSHSVYKQQNGNANTPMTFSVFAKTDVSGKNLGMYVDGITNGIGYISFNLLTGATTVVTGNSGLISYGSQNYGNGWWRCWITGQTTGSGTYYFHLDTNSGTSSVFADTVGYGIYAYGAQMEQASYPSPYVATSGVATPIPSAIAGYRIHAYTTTGTSGFSPASSGTVEVMVVGGGGGGAQAGGGGGGGVIYTNNYWVNAGQQYTVVVGAGGTGSSAASNNCTNGSNSQFGYLVAIGGGYGGGFAGGNQNTQGLNGGSGGGGGSGSGSAYTCYGGQSVNGQGYPGGTGCQAQGPWAAAGGGGAGGAGGNASQNASGSAQTSGAGGTGIAYAILGAPYYWGGGGGGGGQGYHNRNSSSGNTVPGNGGLGGGGGGGNTWDDGATFGAGGGQSLNPGQNGITVTGTTAVQVGGNGGANTGGGGGGQGITVGTSGSGGSGIVIVRYRYD
jgi:hypothetical protein